MSVHIEVGPGDAHENGLYLSDIFLLSLLLLHGGYSTALPS